MKKVLKWALIIISGLIALMIVSIIFTAVQYGPEIEKQNIEEQKILVKKQKLTLDSIITEIKTDKEIKVLKVDYTPDSTLKISLSPSETEVSAVIFDNLYQIIKVGNVSEIEVYKKDKIVSTFGYKTQAKLENFNEKYLSSYDNSCRPVVAYIKQGMNDPNSFEHDLTFVTPLANGNFEVKTIFRGKNVFGGVVLNSSYAEVSSSGSIVSFRMDD